MDTVPLDVYPNTPPSPNQTSTQRQPTLESQRAKGPVLRNPLARLFGVPQSLDEFEQIIDEQIPNLKGKNRSAILRDFALVKSQPAASILQCLVWYKSFVPPIPRPAATWSEPEALHFEKDWSFSLCIKSLGDALQTDRLGAMQLCAVAAEPNPQTLSKSFSFTQKFLYGNLDRLSDMPRRLIAILTSHKWQLSPRFQNLFTRDRALERPNWELRVPSLKPSQGPLDLLQPDGTLIALTWQYRAPKFQSDFDIYIWQQYRKPPSFQYADICILSSSKLLLSFKSSQILKDFTTDRLHGSILGPPSTHSRPWSTVSEVIISVLIVYQRMVKETSVFISESMQEINAMKNLGRRDPSASKFRYLVHLNDCRELAEVGITDGLSSLSRLSDAVHRLQTTQPVWDAGIPFNDRINMIKTDLIYLNRELKLTGRKIDELQNMLREHLSLAQDQRVFILTIVASLYVPLSFISGFFGMNITTNNPQDFSGLSSLTNNSLANLTISERNRTASIITALASSSGRTWDLKYYWIASVPFLLTIPLFLVAGGILRWAIQSAAKYAVYWRIGTVFVVPILLTAVYWGLHWSWIGFAVLTYGGFGYFAAWKLYVAFCDKNKRRLWSFFAAIVVLSCVSDALTRTYGALMTIPWGFLFLRWVSGFFRPRFGARRRIT